MAYNRVEAQFTTANSYATQATSRADRFITSLNEVASSLRSPDLDFSVAIPTSPSLEAAPAAPVFTAISAQFPANSPPAIPTSPDVSILEPTEPSRPSLSPTIIPNPTLRAAPVAPDVTLEWTPPAEPGAWQPPAPPAFLTVNLQPFEGMQTFSSLLSQLTAAPADLSLLQPTPFQAPQIDRYDSAILRAVQELLATRMRGGTGIAPEVEEQIWSRGRDREAAAATTNLAEVMRNAEARGFALPSGALHAELREAQRAQHAKQAELSRDIAIKQAELEQANAKQAIDQALQLEAQLIQYTTTIEQRTFEASRFLAENAVSIYNAVVQQYAINLQKYSTLANVYQTLMAGERSKVDVYRATVEAETAKVEINKSLIEQQRLQLDVRSTEIELYKSLLEAGRVYLEAEKLKIDAFGENVRAYVAEVNAETSRVEGAKIRVEANKAVVDAYRAEVDAYSAKANTRISMVRARAEVYDSQVRAYLGQTQQYATAVGAEAERLRALTGVEALRLDAYRTTVNTVQAVNTTAIEEFRAQVQLYEANKNVMQQQVKLLSDNYFTLRSIVADASKVGAQVNAQLAASAYNTIQANASVSGQDSTSTNFSYAGATSDSRSAPNYV